MITIHWKRIPWKPLLHINALIFIMLKQIVILTFHKFRMTLLLKFWEVLHINNIYYLLRMSGKIVQENMVEHFRNIITTVRQSIHWRDMYKLNGICFGVNSFEQHIILLHSFLNQGEISAHCSLIGMKYSDFNYDFISNATGLFSETVPPKNHGQVSLTTTND